MPNKSYRRKPARLAFTFLAAIFMAYLFAAGHVNKEISQPDLAAIKKLQADAQCQKISSFEGEIACIRTIQDSIKSLIPDMRCAAERQTIEPAEFIQRQHGCCYDRARFTEKALSHYGFKTRHVAIFDMSQYGLFGMFIPGVSSHATSEVYTQKGWMGVDSNESFILITSSNQVLSYKNFRQHADALKYTVKPKDFYSKDLLHIYGLFSRHGMFHGPNLPTPEFNLRELFYNFDFNDLISKGTSAQP